MARPVESKVTKLSVPTALEHGLPLYLASDEALVHMLARYPTDLCDANGVVSFPLDVEGRPDAETVLHDVKTGKLQVTLRDVEHTHPGLWAEALAAFRKFAPQLGVRNTARLTGQLILSSSNAKAPYAFDAAGAMLFHLRGVKRVWVYPVSEIFLPQIAMENVIAGSNSEDLHHVRIYDGAAWRFDLVPGEALAWPLYAPHRVENQEGLCVTLAMHYETAESRLTTGAHLANSVLRRWRLEIAAMNKTPMFARAILWATSRAFTLFGLAQIHMNRIVREFGGADMNPATAANDNLQVAA
jgi:hypothetical protein